MLHYYLFWNLKDIYLEKITRCSVTSVYDVECLENNRVFIQVTLYYFVLFILLMLEAGP